MHIAILYDAASDEALTTYNEAVLLYVQHSNVRLVMAGKPLSKCRPARAAVCAIALQSDTLPLAQGFKAVALSEKQATMFTKAGSLMGEDFTGDWVHVVQTMALQARHAHEIQATQLSHTLTPAATSTIAFPLPSALKIFTTITAVHADIGSDKCIFSLCGAGELRGQPVLLLKCRARVSEAMPAIKRVCQAAMPELVHDGAEGKLQDSIDFSASTSDCDRWAKTVIECMEIDDLAERAQEAKATLAAAVTLPSSLSAGITADISALKHKAVEAICGPLIQLNERVAALMNEDARCEKL
jgi:hypothetical protein